MSEHLEIILMVGLPLLSFVSAWAVNRQQVADLRDDTEKQEDRIRELEKQVAAMEPSFQNMGRQIEEIQREIREIYRVVVEERR